MNELAERTPEQSVRLDAEESRHATMNRAHDPDRVHVERRSTDVESATGLRTSMNRAHDSRPIDVPTSRFSHDSGEVVCSYRRRLPQSPERGTRQHSRNTWGMARATTQSSVRGDGMPDSSRRTSVSR